MRCSSRCASTSLPALTSSSSRSRSSSLIVSIAADDAAARRHVVARRVDRRSAGSSGGCGRSAGRTACSDSTSSSNSSMRIASSLCSAGKTSIVSPRTRNVPREKSISLRVYCIRIRCAITSRWPSLSPRAHDHPHLGVVLGLADAVDRADRGDDDDVAPLEHALGRRQAHLLDVLVDRAVLLDEQVALRHVGLGLVVVVVADEVLDRVLREELAELAVELRRERLVRREHDRRPADAARSRWPS